MLTRQQVYEKIEDEIAFLTGTFGIDNGGVKSAPLPATVEQWLNLIRVAAIHGLDEYGDTRNVPRQMTILAGFCFMCLKRHLIGEVSVTLGDVSIRADRIPTRRTLDGYVLMVDHYLRAAIDGWVTTAGDCVALDNLRKVAAVCVRCLEEHGS